MIKIAIDGGDYNPQDPPKSGIQRLIQSFLTHYSQIEKPTSTVNYYYFSGKEHKNNGEFKNILFHRLPRKLFSSLFLPIKAYTDRNDMFLAFSGIIPRAVNKTGMKKIGVIHDFGFYKYPKAYKNPLQMQKNTHQLISQSNAVVVFSDYIKKELLVQHVNAVPESVHRIYAGIDHLVRDISGENDIVVPDKYFLYVGVVKPIKNIELLLQHFEKFLQNTKSEYKLVLIGIHEKDYFQKLISTPVYARLKDSLIFIDDVVDFELLAYYKKAAAILNVSHEEGFCYPVLEALALGCNAIVNELALYEEYKTYFPQLTITHSHDEFVAAMIKAAKIPPQKQKSVTFPPQFTWKHFTHELVHVMESI